MFPLCSWIVSGTAALFLAGSMQPASAAAIELPLWKRQQIVSEPPLAVLSVDPAAQVSWTLPATGLFASYSPEGDALASVAACGGCDVPVASIDGSAWFLGRSGSHNTGGVTWTLQRYEANGGLVANVSLGVLDGAFSAKLAPHGPDVDVVFVPANDDFPLRIQRVQADGTAGTLRSHPVPGSESMIELLDQRRDAQGRLTLLLVRERGQICAPLQPCPRHPITLLQLDASGEELGRFEYTYPYGWDVERGLGEQLDDDGKVWRLSYAAGGELQLQVIESDGTPGPLQFPDTSIEAPGVWLDDILHAGADRALLAGRSSVNDTTLLLVDAQGQVLASHRVQTSFPRILVGGAGGARYGYLIFLGSGVEHFDAQLLHPDTLAIAAHFDLDGLAATFASGRVAWGAWAVHPEGWLYASLFDQDDLGDRFTLARFAIPGTPAYRPFGSGFEAQP